MSIKQKKSQLAVFLILGVVMVIMIVSLFLISRYAATFEKALELMEKRWGSVSIPWGDIHVIQRGNQLLPAPGAGSTRSTTPFTTLYMTGTSKMIDNRWPADRGSSWMMLVKYHRGSVEAKTILPWGKNKSER